MTEIYGLHFIGDLWIVDAEMQDCLLGRTVNCEISLATLQLLVDELVRMPSHQSLNVWCR